MTRDIRDAATATRHLAASLLQQEEGEGEGESFDFDVQELAICSAQDYLRECIEAKAQSWLSSQRRGGWGEEVPNVYREEDLVQSLKDAGLAPRRSKEEYHLNEINYAVVKQPQEECSHVSPTCVVTLSISPDARNIRNSDLELLLTHTLGDVHMEIACPARQFEAGLRFPSFFFTEQGNMYHDDAIPGGAEAAAAAFLPLDAALRRLVGESSGGYADFTWTKESMWTMQVGRLTSNVGCHFYYCHAGTCLHRIALSDVKWSTSGLKSPRAAVRVRHRAPKCTVCCNLIAERRCVSDSLLASSPAQLCQFCHHMLHYTRDGRLAHTDFRVYETIGRTPVRP